MSERILVCTHGEPGALGALRLANALAERDGYALDVLAVIAPVFMEGVTLYSLPGEYVAEEGQSVDEYRERIREQQRAVGGPLAAVEPHVEIGHVAHAIATCAQSQSDGIILLGAGKHGRAERWGGAETSLYVSRLARVPVLAVPPDAGALPEVGVVAVDFSEYSRDAALTAARLLGPAGRLHLVHATWLDAAVGPGDWVITYESGAQTRMEGFARELRAQRPLQSVESEVLSGDPTERVLRRAHQTGAGLVAAGSHGHGFFTRTLLGRTSTELLRGAACSVLIAPPRAASDELEGAAERREQAVRMQADGAVSALVG